MKKFPNEFKIIPESRVYFLDFIECDLLPHILR